MKSARWMKISNETAMRTVSHQAAARAPAAVLLRGCPPPGLIVSSVAGPSGRQDAAACGYSSSTVSSSSCRRRRTCRVAAAPSSEGSNAQNLSPADLPAVALPESQDQAIAEAAKSVQVMLQAALASSRSKAAVAKTLPKKKGQGFTAQQPTAAAATSSAPLSSKAVAIEIPSADQSPASVATVSLSIAASLMRQLQLSAGSFTIVFANDAAAASAAAALQRPAPGTSAAAAAAAGVSRVLGLRDACRSDGLRGVLMLVEPKVADVALVEQLLTEVWGGPACILLNPEFPAAPVPEQYKNVSESIQVVWSFLPLQISGLLGGMEGAVVRRVTSAAQDPGWRILYKTGNKFVQVGQTKQRPSRDDLELTMMNASAASSPLTRGVKLLKNLMPKKKD